MGQAKISNNYYAKWVPESDPANPVVVEDVAWSINPAIEFYGVNCVSPNNHPKDSAYHYPIIMS